MRNKVIGFALMFLYGLLLNVTGYAGSSSPPPSSVRRPTDISSISALLQKLTGVDGRSGVWKFWEDQNVGSDEQIHLRGWVVFRPFASSAGLCRTYVIEIESPSRWVYGHGIRIGYGKHSYQIHSGLRMAIRRDKRDCQEIEFSEYFEVSPEMTDQQVVKFLGYIETVTTNWNAQQNVAGRAPIGLSQLASIELSDKNGKSVAQFGFNVGDGGFRVFEVSLPVSGKPKYATTLEIP